MSVHNGFNLTVDSNDDGALDWDDDLFEEEPPGKLIGVNDGDADSDGITDFADFSTIGAAFVPLHVKINAPGASASEFQVTSSYDASDPAAVTGSGTAESPFVPGPGTLRIWKKDASSNRSASDYIGTDTMTAAELGLTPWGTTTLYVEAVRGAGSDREITVTVDANGNGWSGTLDDTVLVRPIGVDLDVDSNNDGFITASDDPIEREAPGKVIRWNGDDDNGNDLPDREEAGLTVAENDLVVASLSLEGADGSAAGPDAVLEFGPQVRLWTSPDKQEQIFSGATYTTGAGGNMPSQVYIEGYIPGSTTISLALQDRVGTEVSRDDVMVTVVQVDLDIDSNNDGIIDTNDTSSGTDDWIETQAPGRVLPVSEDGNSELAEVRLDVRGLPSSAFGDYFVTLEGDSSLLRVWDSVTRSSLIPFGTSWGLANLPSTVFVEGLATGAATMQLTLVHAMFGAMAADAVETTPVQADLDVYRAPTAHLVSWEVPAAAETSPGVGIRRNGDENNANNTPDLDDTGPVNGENDLLHVEVKLVGPGGQVLPGQFLVDRKLQLVLTRDNKYIDVYDNSRVKDRPVLDNDQQEYAFHYKDGQQIKADLYVEWATMDTTATEDFLNLRIRPDGGEDFHGDRLRFYPFNSIIIGYMGENHNPADDNSEGIYLMIDSLYKQGYDVRIYKEDDLGSDYVPDPNNWWSGERDSYEALLTSKARGVTNVVIFGYSHGGGATYRISDIAKSAFDASFQLKATGYIDGVTKSGNPDITGTLPEYRKPVGTAYHHNLYQQPSENFDDLWAGAEVDGAHNDNVEEQEGANDIFIEGTVHHLGAEFSIDNYGVVRTNMLQALTSKLKKADGTPDR